MSVKFNPFGDEVIAASSSDDDLSWNPFASPSLPKTEPTTQSPVTTTPNPATQESPSPNIVFKMPVATTSQQQTTNTSTATTATASFPSSPAPALADSDSANAFDFDGTASEDISVVVSPAPKSLKSALSTPESLRKNLRVSFPAKLFVKITEDGTEEESYVLYQTLYEFKSDHPDDLTFGPNEILQVTDEGDGPESWFTGRTQDGRQGVFPGTFVRKIVMRTNAPEVAVDVENGGVVKPLKKELQPHEYECYQALFDYHGESDEDLSFKANDIIRVTDKGDGPESWWTGQDQEGNDGVFPGTFVRKIGGEQPQTFSLAGLEHTS